MFCISACLLVVALLAMTPLERSMLHTLQDFAMTLCVRVDFGHVSGVHTPRGAAVILQGTSDDI